MSDSKVSIAPVSSKRDLNAFVDVHYRLNEGDPNFVPQLRSELVELLTPGKNPFFEHARHQFFLARHDSDPFNRWQALQSIAMALLVANVTAEAAEATGSSGAFPRISTSLRWRSRRTRASAPVPASGACSRPRTRKPAGR